MSSSNDGVSRYSPSTIYSATTFIGSPTFVGEPTCINGISTNAIDAIGANALTLSSPLGLYVGGVLAEQDKIISVAGVYSIPLSSPFNQSILVVTANVTLVLPTFNSESPNGTRISIASIGTTYRLALSIAPNVAGMYFIYSRTDGNDLLTPAPGQYVTVPANSTTTIYSISGGWVAQCLIGGNDEPVVA